MNLSELGNLFTEMPSGEIMGAIKEELSEIDQGFGNLCVSPKTSDSPFRETDGLSASALKSDVSGADRLLLAFNSINIAKPTEATDDGTATCFKVGGFESNGDVDLSGPDKGKDASKFDSIDLPPVTDSSAHWSTDGDVFDGIDSTSKSTRPVILYTSSQRNARKLKVNQNESQEKPSKHGKMAREKSAMDFSSLQILRKSRSSISKRPRSSVWGYLGNAVPGSKEHDMPALNLGTKKKGKRIGGKGKRNPPKGQQYQEAIEKRCPPTGRISLKIKIGNKLCSIGNATENCSSSGKGTTGSIGTVENMFEEKVPAVKTSSPERNSEKLTHAFALSQPLDAKVSVDNSSFSTSNDFRPMITLEEGDTLTASVENLCSDVGTSPDSEVINTVPDVPLCEKALPDMHNSPVLSTPCVSPSHTSSLVLSPKKSKKGNKKDKLHQEGNCDLEIKPNDAECPVNVRVPLSMRDTSSMSLPKTKSKKGKKKVKLREPGYNTVRSKQVGSVTTNVTEIPANVEVNQKLSEAMVTSSNPYLDYIDSIPCAETVAATGPSNVEACGTIPCSNGRKYSKCSRAKKGSKCRSKISDSSSKKVKSSKKKANKNPLGGRHPVNEETSADGALSKVESLQAAGNQTPNELGDTRALSSGSAGVLNSQQLSSDGVMDPYAPSRSAWVLCDECEKWRRIPATLADQIEETNRSWTCKENTDIDFADCSVPQEKSDSAINEELGISDGSCEEDAGASIPKPFENHPKAVQKSSWSLIKSNLFLHRSRKKQTIDEVMVCHCKPPSDGRMGCGTKCLNRMLNIECVKGTCPCGEVCSNQQFQKRNYSKLKWFKCGKKGYGLQALEDVIRGQFLIEYVGEVLDVHAYEARQREYALDGHRHFYFMTLNGSEVIDACAKGNLGRFINHSCDPNCRTEKWMVNGEVCIGLFSLRDIKKGEEITFDYNYVRVFGAAAKKCVCGSPNCRGYIGGDPTSSEVIVQDDSDDEFSEPDMICEDRELNEEWSEIISSSLNHKENEITPVPIENRYNMEKLRSTIGENAQDSQASQFVTEKVEGINCTLVAGTVADVDDFSGTDLIEQLEINKQRGDSLNKSLLANRKAKSDDIQLQMPSSELVDNSLRRDGSLNKEISSTNESVVAAASPSKPLSDTVESKGKLKNASVGGKDGLSKSNSIAKTKRSSSSVRKVKPKANVLNEKGSIDVDKLNAKSKKLPGLSMTNHFEAVEAKLNELLDPQGGISKRKDASRGYLKLLILTAATGNNGHGEAIQSNRDLSMILDALLKTKSRSVLVDIINKNGLQMLHNIMKRYRKEFFKTPILRKLLKVLEHLALRQILTLEHITGGPACPGVESFKDSILVLTEHDDKQVHQIARSFRDRWIPRSLRKSCCIERDNSGMSEINQMSNHDGLLTSNNHHRNDQDGKPSETTNSCDKQLGTVETSTPDPSASGPTKRKRKSRWDTPAQNPIDEDIPPGFSSPCNGHPIPSDTSSEAGIPKQHQPCDVVLGNSQIRFNARMHFSYGISKSFFQKFGVPQLEPTNCWSIAPAVPFLPFPPLPPQPCSIENPSTPAARSMSVSEHIDDTSVAYQTGQKRTRTSSMDPPDNNFSVPNGQPDNGLGRKFFRQQKSNHSKLAPPWVRMRNGRGYPGNSPQNNAPGVDGFGNGFRNLYNWQETNWRG